MLCVCITLFLIGKKKDHDRKERKRKKTKIYMERPNTSVKRQRCPTKSLSKVNRRCTL